MILRNIQLPDVTTDDVGWNSPCAQPYSGAGPSKLASLPVQPSVNGLSCTQPKVSPEMLAGVYACREKSLKQSLMTPNVLKRRRRRRRRKRTKKKKKKKFTER